MIRGLVEDLMLVNDNLRMVVDVTELPVRGFLIINLCNWFIG